MEEDRRRRKMQVRVLRSMPGSNSCLGLWGFWALGLGSRVWGLGFKVFGPWGFWSLGFEV